MLLINGEYLSNTFFVAGGVLSCIFIFPLLEKEKEKSFAFLIKATIFRYIRLAPVMLLFLLFNSTWSTRIGSGPFWDKTNLAERQFCRKNWWINALFLNNYFSGDEKCLLPMWYLSTDFHLSIIGIILMILVIKYHDKRYKIFGAAIITSFFMSVAVIYFKDLDPIFIISPE